MHVWRINRHIYSPLDGEGARLKGQRWNKEGSSVVYTAAHLSLTVLEFLVHVDPEDIPDGLTAFRIEVPDKLGITAAGELPEDWKTDIAACQAVGENWMREGQTAILSVPSAVIELERNFVLNPRHPDFHQIRVVEQRPFAFDDRLPGFRVRG